MPKIGIVPNLTREKAYDTTVCVAKNLDKLNIDYYFESKLSDKFNFGNFTDNIYIDSDLIIAIGGDGSFIHTAKQSAICKKPVLCINAGNLAFLAGLEGNELSLLANLLDGNYTTDKRMMLKAVMKKDNREIPLGFCLNDVVVARGKDIKLINLDVLCDNRMINDYRADGIIISTPTGSTAYSWSAGGPVIDPALECIMLTPICTHSPLNRSLVFNENSQIKIIPSSGWNQELSISVDGDEAVSVSGDCEIIISKSEFYAEFIRIKSDEFFDILNNKLTQRRV